MQVFTDIKGTGTYATYARAVKRAEEVAEILGEVRGPVRWLIATNEAGRFFPVFIGQASVDAIHLGCCVTG
jgi:hypothetical protein